MSDAQFPIHHGAADSAERDAATDQFAQQRPDSTDAAEHEDLGPGERPAPRSRRHDATEDASIRAFCVEAARLMSDLHCEDVVIFDVRELSDVTDYIIIASGTSDRQIKSVADDLAQLAKQSYALSRFGRETDKEATWIVVDFVDVIVHLFEPNTRAHYDLEMMWGDAPTVLWQR